MCNTMAALEEAVREKYQVIIDQAVQAYKRPDVSVASLRTTLEAIAPIQKDESRATYGIRETRPEVTLAKGGRYTGEWLAGSELRQGYGSQINADGSRYDGHLLNNYPHGMGRMIDANLDLYHGQWNDGEEQGLGFKYNATDQSYYIGNWHEARSEGLGIEMMADGSIYKGSFVAGRKEGKGLLETSRGTYSGRFSQNLANGHGKFEGTNGQSYVGMWKNGKWHGQGSLTKRSEGQTYIGEFKEGLMHGKIRVTDKHGRQVKAGTWQNGAF